MRILFVTPYAPTPIRTRPHNFIRSLAARGHALTLATVWESDVERDALQEVRGWGVAVQPFRLSRARMAVNLLSALPAGAPLQASYSWHPGLSRFLEAAARPDDFDVAHVEHLRGARYALQVNRALPTVWDSVDCISHLFAQALARSRSWRTRLMAGFELGRTRRHEARLVRTIARVLVTAETDRLALEALAPAAGAAAPAPLTVVPNGVVLDGCRPGAEHRAPGAIVFSGKMSYHANATAALWLVHEIMPLVWRERSDARLWIVGQAPSAAVKRLAADPRVTVTGFVPEVSAYLARAAVAACPTVYGAGIQNKVLEAMACATPVVCSRDALRALGARAESEVLAAGTPAEFAGQILRLLADEPLARRLGAAGRSYVERAHDWSSITQLLEAAYGSARETWTIPVHRA